MVFVFVSPALEDSLGVVFMSVSLSESGVVVVGKLIVPWSSRMARPEGVWRSGGRGLLWVFGLRVLDLLGGWSGIEGMVSVCLAGCLYT